MQLERGTVVHSLFAFAACGLGPAVVFRVFHFEALLILFKQLLFSSGVDGIFV